MKEYEKDLPLQKEVESIVKAKQEFVVRMTFSQLVEELVKLDKIIDRMEEGHNKELAKKEQEQSWAILFNDKMFGSIITEE